MAGPPPPQKLCPSCGTSVNADSNVCSNCGYNFNTGPYTQPPSPGGYGTYSSPTGGGPTGYSQAQANYPRDGYAESSTGTADGMGIASLVLGILSIPLMCVCYTGVPFAILALIFGGLGLKGRNRSLSIAGMICAGLAILLVIAIILFAAAIGMSSRSGSNPFD
jgi:hypothetical protein